jgi:hypothetical protein
LKLAPETLRRLHFYRLPAAEEKASGTIPPSILAEEIPVDPPAAVAPSHTCALAPQGTQAERPSYAPTKTAFERKSLSILAVQKVFRCCQLISRRNEVSDSGKIIQLSSFAQLTIAHPDLLHATGNGGVH